MKNFFYRYEQSIRKQPMIWHPGYIIHRIIQKEIIHFSRFISKKNTGAVLDFGCGKKPFKPYFTAYQGADIDNKDKETDYLINLKNNRIEGVQDNSIENVISVEVIEHVQNLDAYLTEVKRVLKSDGYFLIIAPFVYNFHGSDDYARYSSNYFRKHSSFQDFKIIEINSTPNDFIEFMIYNFNHFFEIFPIFRFFYPIFIITNTIGILFSAFTKSLFQIASIFSPKFDGLYDNSFLLFPLQISVILQKKTHEKN